MKNCFNSMLTALVCLIAVSACGRSAGNPDSSADVDAAGQLAGRVLGSRAAGIAFEKIPTDSLDVFTVESRGGKIVIGGSNVNAMACGLNHYLRYFCNVEVGWMKCNGFSLPRRWPSVDGKVTVHAKVRDRFFLNYCTYGYAMPWWGWDEWEHFIDWMALNGVNLTLAITGQESVWYDVWKDMGMTDDQIRSYFTGPAHLPWHRMTNIDHWGGPLPQSWLDGQEVLQKRIVERERSLGMRTALPAFNGHVPEQLCDMFPDAPITQIKPWAGYTREEAPWFLDPTSELYASIQKKFIEKQTEKYGSDHIYGLDVFNEIMPPDWSPAYLGRVAGQIYDTLHAADPEAVWLQMGWMFSWRRNLWTTDRVKAYLGGIPADRQLMLEYHADGTEVWRMTDSFFGTPFIWCYLSNFGGNTHIAPRFIRAVDRLEAAYAETRLTGVGCTLESLDCDRYTHECILEKAWDMPETDSMDSWFSHLAMLRGGIRDEKLETAWRLVENCLVSESRSCAFCQRGAVELRPDRGMKTDYVSVDKGAAVLSAVIRLMLDSRGRGDAFEYDAVNFTRQWMACRFWQMFRSYQDARTSGDTDRMERVSAGMLGLIADMDELLGSREEFLLGKWIEDARKMGTSPEEMDYYEENAREILTSWSMENNPSLNDYAAREWNGLLKGLYLPRWKAYFDAEKAGGFDRKEFCDGVLSPMEAAFWKHDREKYPSVPQGNPVALSRKFFEKYQPSGEL